MSYCKEEGKDKIIFVTEEDHRTPSTVQLGNDVESEPGLIKEDGEINWNCPCLGGMAAGPCGYEFRQAFSCFHYSTADPKGSDCVDQFRGMQECMAKYPQLYDNEKDDVDKLAFEDADEEASSLPEHSASSKDQGESVNNIASETSANTTMSSDK